MQITSVSPNFNTRISGQHYSVYNRQTKERIRKESTYNKMFESYNSGTRKIEEEKARAIELDAFIRTDKKLKNL